MCQYDYSPEKYDVLLIRNTNVIIFPASSSRLTLIHNGKRSAWIQGDESVS